MSDKIIINVMLESNLTTQLEQIYNNSGDTGLNAFARKELQKLLEGDDSEIDWAARLLGITIKRE